MPYTRIIHNEVEAANFKITVEEIGAFKFISTYWDKEDCEEEDRRVKTFETYGGALDHAFEELASFFR